MCLLMARWHPLLALAGACVSRVPVENNRYLFQSLKVALLDFRLNLYLYHRI